MKWVRVWAAVASGLFAVLLVVIAVLSIGEEERVTPAVRVQARAGIGDGAPAALSAAELLGARARLQTEAAVANGERVDELSSKRGELVMVPGVENAPNLVRGWLSQGPQQQAQLLNPPAFREGQSSLPYRVADVLMQPEGREFRRLHNDRVRYGGGWLIFGVLLALALFLAGRGRIQLVEGESGERILRFSELERANHWMTASAFIVMALTGLVIIYGKPLLLPWMGSAAFSALAAASVWAHMAAAVPFVLGVLIMIVLWFAGNLPTRVDWEWLKRGGGLLRDDGNRPPAERFNAGQKIVFWSVVLGGLALLATGVQLMLPFYWLGYDGMQRAQLLHAGIGLCMLALVVGHIYIGTVGMEGAFDAMWSGLVDRNWAREHHGLWYRRLTREGDADRSAPRVQPGE